MRNYGYGETMTVLTLGFCWVNPYTAAVRALNHISRLCLDPTLGTGGFGIFEAQS